MSFIKNAAIIYQGPSVLDGGPIVVISTGASRNAKTGNLLQTWIIRTDQPPVEAKKNGSDESVCGICPIKKECYVKVFQAPGQVYRAFKNGRYRNLSQDPVALAEYVKGQRVRWGAYGDIAAIPFDIVKHVNRYALSWTAYTHQRRHNNFDPRLLTIAQVSVESAKESEEIRKKGLGNTFRVVADYSHKMKHEIICPSESGVSCAECMACNGSRSIVIKAHGASGNKLAQRIEKRSKPLQGEAIPVKLITEQLSFAI